MSKKNGKQYNNLMKEMKLSEKYTKATYKKPKYDKVKDVIFEKQDYNFQADLLMLPMTKNKYRYLLTIVDLWSDELDAEPLKTKQPQEILKAMKNIYKRKHLNQPKARLRTDGGTEFKAEVAKYLYDNSILHSITLPGRHTQNANIENVNRLISRYLIAYMNSKTKELKKEYNEWTDLLPSLITKLNVIRKRPDGDPYEIDSVIPFETIEKQKYKVGDLVYRKLDIPKNSLNNYESIQNFRTGDYRYDIEEPKKIKKVVYYANNVRYILNGFPNVAYRQDELLPVEKEKNDEKFAVKKIWDKKIVKKQVFYRVWWKKYLKKESTWEKKQQLVEDGLQNEIDAYENSS